MTDFAATVRAIVQEEQARFAVPGCCVAVVRDDEVVLAEGFGTRNLEAGLPVTDQTLFPIGSSTKAFSASLIATLVDDGHFGWDTPVIDVLPGFRMYDPTATLHLTPRDMLCHRSGLPRHDLLWYNNTALTRSDVVARLRYLAPSRQLRQTFQYNNLLYITAGHLAEHTLGCTWEQAVRDRLLEPLGMTNTNFAVAESQKSDDHSLPYLEKESECHSIPLRGIDLAGPAGSINSCAADMARWALLNAGGGEVEGGRVLSSAAMRELHAPAMAMQGNELSVIAELYTETFHTAYALGWILETYRGHKVVQHGGNIDGFSAMVSLLPEQRLGLVVLTNLNSTPLRDVIPYRVYDHVLDLDPLPWGTRFREVQQSMQAGMKAAQQHLDSKKRNAPPSHPLADYAGRYTHPGYGTFGVSFDDGALVPHYNDIDGFELVHRHYDVWELRLEIFGAVLPLTFGTGADGEIESLSVQLEAMVEPQVFVRQPDLAWSEPARLESLTGRFVMGPVVLTIDHPGGSELDARLMGERYRLVAHREFRFKVVDHPALSVEFELGENGAVARVVVDPVGVFEPEEAKS
jgi:CubicO group peptidase (beta-lactamase class C family)